MAGRKTDTRAGEALTSMRYAAAVLWEDKEYTLSDRLERASDSLVGVLRERGLACSCSVRDTVVGPKTVCSCKEVAGKGRKKGLLLKTQPAAFRGALGAAKKRRCRDGQGRFVPTEACRGPVGRDLETGRYVSIK